MIFVQYIYFVIIPVAFFAWTDKLHTATEEYVLRFHIPSGRTLTGSGAHPGVCYKCTSLYHTLSPPSPDGAQLSEPHNADLCPTYCPRRYVQGDIAAIMVSSSGNWRNQCWTAAAQ